MKKKIKKIFIIGSRGSLAKQIIKKLKNKFSLTKISRKNIKKLYLIFNKPKGIVCTTDAGVEKDNIIDYINHPQRIFPIGRLDKTREYYVTVDKPINNDFVKKMSNGIPILSTVTKKCEVKFVKDYEFKIILTQGLNRQIRRMCEFLGYRVKKLKRTRIMNIKIDLPVGQWRYFSAEELSELKNSLSSSISNYGN